MKLDSNFNCLTFMVISVQNGDMSNLSITICMPSLFLFIDYNITRGGYRGGSLGAEEPPLELQYKLRFG